MTPIERFKILLEKEANSSNSKEAKRARLALKSRQFKSLRRSLLTPSRSDIGKPVQYVPEHLEGVLVDVYGIFAKFKFKPKGRGKSLYAETDVRNLKLIKSK